MKLREIPVFLILFISFAASFLMGCSGGGSSGGLGGGGGATTPLGKAPLELVSGMTFVFSGRYDRVEPSDGSVWEGNVSKQLIVTSSSSGTSVDLFLSTSDSSSLTYNRIVSLPDQAKIVATNYPYRGPNSTPLQRGTIELLLVFTSTTGGNYSEIGVGLPTTYNGYGSFTLSGGASVGSGGASAGSGGSGAGIP